MIRYSRQLFSAVRSKKVGALSKLTAEEEGHLRAVSTRIIADKYCEIPSQEASLYLYPLKSLYSPSKLAPGILDTALWMLYRRNVSASRFTELTTERVNNKELMELFGLNHTNFNHRVYWLTIHSWMIHQRFLVESLKKLESDYVDRIWLMPYKWMMDKGVPRHRLQVELEHAHRYSLKFSVELDQAINRPEILPGQIGEVLWRTIFPEDAKVKSPADARIVLLTKYIIRNLNFVLNAVPTDNFTQGAFIWPGMFLFMLFYVLCIRFPEIVPRESSPIELHSRCLYNS